MANSYDSSANTYITASNVYSWSDVNKRFNLVQSIQTNGARDADCVKIGNENYLLFTNSKANSMLYRFKETSPIGFVFVQELVHGNSGKFFKWNNTGMISIVIKMIRGLIDVIYYLINHLIDLIVYLIIMIIGLVDDWVFD